MYEVLENFIFCLISYMKYIAAQELRGLDFLQFTVNFQYSSRTN